MEEYVRELIEKKAIRYVQIDSEQFVDTGEIVTVGVPIKRDELAATLIDSAPNQGFTIFRDVIMHRVLKNLGVKGKILAYLLKKKPETNILGTSVKEISIGSETSVQAVSDCLKMLEEIGAISIKSTGPIKEIFVNPGVAHRGNRWREKALMNEFAKFEKEAKKLRKQKGKEKESK